MDAQMNKIRPGADKVRMITMKNNNVGNILFALLLVLFGIVLLLVNIGIISMEIKEILVFSYPILFIMIGLKGLLDAVRPGPRRGGWFWSLLFILFGTLLMLDRFDIITFKFGMIWKLWPLLLVYIGFKMLTLRNKSVKHQSMFGVGDMKFNEENWKVEQMNLWNAVGDYYLDFSKAFIPDKETDISISGWAGDIKIIVPEDLEFAIDATVKAGDIRVFTHKESGVNRTFSYKTHNYDEAVRKINFRVSLKAGDIRVDKV